MKQLFLDTSLVFWPPDFSAMFRCFQLTNYVANFMNSVLMAVRANRHLAGPVGVRRLWRRRSCASAARNHARGVDAVRLHVPSPHAGDPGNRGLRWIGLSNSLWEKLLIAHPAIALPLAVWLLWGFFESMPFDLEEAAMVDGCCSSRPSSNIPCCIYEDVISFEDGSIGHLD